MKAKQKKLTPREQSVLRAKAVQLVAIGDEIRRLEAKKEALRDEIAKEGGVTAESPLEFVGLGTMRFVETERKTLDRAALLKYGVEVETIEKATKVSASSRFQFFPAAD